VSATESLTGSFYTRTWSAW